MSAALFYKWDALQSRKMLISNNPETSSLTGDAPDTNQSYKHAKMLCKRSTRTQGVSPIAIAHSGTSRSTKGIRVPPRYRYRMHKPLPHGVWLRHLAPHDATACITSMAHWKECRYALPSQSHLTPTPNIDQRYRTHVFPFLYMKPETTVMPHP
jgi:hypothetical protein